MCEMDLGGCEQVTLVVPLPPNLANARMHWRTKERHRSEYFSRLDFLYAARMLPRVSETWAHATARATLYMPRAMDDDNALHRCKWPMDWIVRKGYLRDDNRTCLRWEALPEQSITSMKHVQAIHITLTRSADL